ncbi:hypothetical protein EG68_04503 [Paragonimus skrjabini miyazakii]|uniref:Uncharacterized protein n=1 Tax=Paragonimus skrjabini miyazakii TaxID=59628 RepID=A0A8S9Z3T5_9TREM|nr:hypothetical protein EG68_04503 [Paragonimus skrjabini miyazakii]
MTSNGHTMKQFTSTGVGPRTSTKTHILTLGNSRVHESFKKEMNEIEHDRLQPILQQYIFNLGSHYNLIDGTGGADSVVNVLHVDNLPEDRINDSRPHIRPQLHEIKQQYTLKSKELRGSLYYVDKQQHWQPEARVNFEYIPNESTILEQSEYASSVHLDESELPYGFGFDDGAPMRVTTVGFVCPQKKARDYSG